MILPYKVVFNLFHTLFILYCILLNLIHTCHILRESTFANKDIINLVITWQYCVGKEEVKESVVVLNTLSIIFWREINERKYSQNDLFLKECLK